MAPKVYIETTIPSYLAANSSRDLIIAGHQELTREWWSLRRGDFELYISQFVEDECRAGDATYSQKRLELIEHLPLLELDANGYALAEQLINNGPLPEKAQIDALHISVAASNAMDYLLTWNCKHIANASMQRAIGRICRESGFEPPVICTPEELLEG